MSINSMFTIGKDALIMNQYALGIVSDNIANINVEGYTKQRVEQETIHCDIPLKGAYGIRLTSMGARIAAITRYSNAFLDGQIRDGVSDSAFYDELNDAAGVIENLMNELSGNNGLTSAFSEFYSALNDLASNPSDLATRAVVAQKAENITVKFNQYAKTLNSERKNLVGSGTDPNAVENSVAASKVSNINNLLTSLKEINISMANLTKTTSASSSLEDKRTEVLKQLSEYIPIEVTYNNANNTCNISFNGTKLVEGGIIDGTFDIKATGDDNDPAQIVIVDNEGNETDVTSDLKTGSLGAMIQLGSATSTGLSYAGILSQLDTLACEFAKAFNDLQTYVDTATGKAALSITLDANGNKILKAPTVDTDGNLVSTNDPIFEASDGSATINAGNISVNANILSNPYGIATAYGDVDTSTGDVANPLAVGDTEALLDMLALRNKGIVNLNGNTFDSYMTEITTGVGVQVSTINSYKDTTDTALDQLLETKISLSGVNLDEELVDLIRYQRAYEAAARVFNTASDVMQTLVNLAR